MRKITLVATASFMVFSALFSGCAYPNECGISYNYYDAQQSYYDSQGNFIKKCPENNYIDYKKDMNMDRYLE